MDKSLPSIDALGRLALALGAVLACVAWLGCSQPGAAVSGSVTLDGRPLGEAVIIFVPLDDAGRKTGAEVVAGRYTLSTRDGLRPGRYRVEFVDQPAIDLPSLAPAQVAPADHTKPRRASATDAHTKAHAQAFKKRRELPIRYALDSPLVIEFVAGRTRLDFALVADPSD